MFKLTFSLIWVYLHSIKYIMFEIALAAWLNLLSLKYTMLKIALSLVSVIWVDLPLYQIIYNAQNCLKIIYNVQNCLIIGILHFIKYYTMFKIALSLVSICLLSINIQYSKYPYHCYWYYG